MVFVGSVVSREAQESLRAASPAGNNFQLGFLGGAATLGVRLTVVAVEPHAMGKRPGDRLVIRASTQPLVQGLVGRTVGFVNIPGVKQLCIAVGTLSRLVVWRLRGWEDSGGNTVILYNSLSYQFLPCYMASRLFRCQFGVVVADLPLGRTRNALGGVIEKVEQWLEVGSLRHADFLVPLTRHTQPDLAPNVPSIVVEGGHSEIDRAGRVVARDATVPRRLLYAGSLNSVSGIALAIQAVRLIPDGEVVLHIYGSGTAEQVASVRAYQSDSIVYHGTVERREILQIESEVDMLLSPRIPDEFVTRYTFPSKLLEYMASGTPVLSNCLDGIPEEYLGYVVVPASPTPEAWAATIREVCWDESGEYERTARRARRFVLEQKSWAKQAARVVEFLRKQARGA
ncbi:Glycosyltransferase involved in cell wall bisynthesis [Nocardioides szechwanensis]|uniref:Glycosyltransferase involved in cell wall bisynthesis n=1 Tax=Nocardioides szechwanensis TaxID=1005944 RepID=A0A1H0BQ56_9ACTN|nr:Glycosyltransferase involved in cell wall bisynthesis [Nocardioides szechwanensis]